jgi:hypothetical protein
MRLRSQGDEVAIKGLVHFGTQLSKQVRTPPAQTTATSIDVTEI